MNQSSHTRKWRFAAPAGIAALVVILVMAIGPVFAAGLAGSGFDSGDGNLTVEGALPMDWANVAETRQNDLPSGQADDSFSQGSKEDTLVPAVEFGSIPPNKSDLKTFGVYAEKTGSGKNFLHLYWTRVQDPSGTTNMDFEFNQQSTLSSNGVTPLRTTGDLLITYDLSRGGTVPTISIRLWSGSAWGAAQDLSSQGKATGSINTTAIAAADSDGLGDLSPRTFGEASVDLDAIFPTNTCNPLGSAFLKSRSSDSFTAAMKDFIAPTAVNISNCGTIIIRKLTEPIDDPANPDTSFSYNTTGGLNPATFNLSTGGTRTYNGVPAGSYTIVETVDSHYELHELTCTASGSGTSATGTPATATASITLAAGGTVDCTYTNDYKDHIQVDKVTFPANDPQVFQFSLTGGPVSVNQSFGLADQTAIYDSGPLNSGSGYAVSEVVPPGWSQTSVNCTDGSTTYDPANITAGTGGSVLCTFTNTKLGRIIIEKQTNPNGSPQTFNFTTNYGANGFTLTDGQQNDSGLMMPGTYSVSETLPAGWEQTSATCSGGNTLPNIVLDAGETVNCTFTNTQKFVTIVLVCEQAPGTLYPSAVNAATSLTQAQMVAAGFTAPQIQTLCGLNQGARFANLNPGGPVNYGVTIPSQYPPVVP